MKQQEIYRKKQGFLTKALLFLCVAALGLLTVSGCSAPQPTKPAVTDPAVIAPIDTEPNQQPSGNQGSVAGDFIWDEEVLSKTVMIYLDGADLEEQHANASQSILEILDSNVDTEKHNILFYTGGSDVWHNFDIPTDKDCILLLRNGTLHIVGQCDAQNMGYYETLEAFMQFCVTNYPAQQYGLILQDHGGGPNLGVCVDYRHNHDILSMQELQLAFQGAGFGPNKKMEFVLFDACLMASAEVAFSIKDYANYMVASENVSYTYGSDYSFIEAINWTNSGEIIGKRYVDCFYYESVDLGARIHKSGQSVYDITYSCIDLSKMANLEQTLNTFFQEVNQSAFWQSMMASTAQHTRGVKEFSDSYSTSTDNVYDLIDLKDWLEQASWFMENADPVLNAIDAAVVYNQSTTDKMHGLTIYFPRHCKKQYAYNQLGFSREYTRFVEQCYADASNVANIVPWDSLTAEAHTEDTVSKLSVVLTKEQQEKFASAKYYILSKHGDLSHEFTEDEYLLVMQSNDCTLNENGVLTAAFDYQIPVVHDKDGNSKPFFSPLSHNKTEHNDTLYSSYASLFFVPDGEDYPGERDPDGLNETMWIIENMRLDVAYLTLEEREDGVYILCAEKSSDGLPSRVFLDPLSYQEISFSNPIRRVKYDSDGKLLPVSEWTIDNSLTATLTLDINDFSIQMETLSQDVEYYGVMVVTDIYGNEYATDILQLN